MTGLTIDKSKGLGFSVEFNGDKVDFYHGIHSPKSYIAKYKGLEIYLSSPYVITSSIPIEEFAKRRISEELYYESKRS